MDNSIDSTLKTYKRLMICAGIWPRKQNYFFYDIFRYINLIILASTATSLVVTFCYNFNNFEESSLCLSSAAAIYQAFGKISLLFLKNRKFRKLLRFLRKTTMDVQEDYLQPYFQKRILISNRLRNIFLGSALVTFVVTVVTPIISNKNDRNLPLPFAINANELPLYIYVFIYFVQSCAALLTAWASCLIDSLLFTLMWIAVAQCEILNHKIVHATSIVAENANYENGDKFKNINLNRYLQHCVMYHVTIEKYVKLLEESSSINFLMSMESLIPICLMGFGFVILPVASAQFGRCLVFFLTVLIQFSLFCVPGHELIYQSRKIGDSCYAFEWENYDGHVGKTLFLMMERAKRPFMLTATKIVILSMDSLIAFLKAAMSYFMVLWHLFHDKSKQA